MFTCWKSSNPRPVQDLAEPTISSPVIAPPPFLHASYFELWASVTLSCLFHAPHPNKPRCCRLCPIVELPSPIPGLIFACTSPIQTQLRRPLLRPPEWGARCTFSGRYSALSHFVEMICAHSHLPPDCNLFKGRRNHAFLFLLVIPESGAGQALGKCFLT